MNKQRKTNSCHPELVSGSSRSIKGFTLIELLVVVLIIGILAAVALPQYQKAVWKSKAVALQQQLMEVVRAQELYYTTHGEYAYKFDDLEWKPSLPTVKNPAKNGGLYLADVVGNDQIILGLSHESYVPLVISTAILQTGPYAGSGFRYIHATDEEKRYNDKTLYCVDPFATFCRTIMGLPASWHPGYAMLAYPMN